MIAWFPLLIITPFFYARSLDEVLVNAYGSGSLLAPFSLLCFSVVFKQYASVLKIFLLFSAGVLALVFQGFFISHTLNDNTISVTAITVIVVLYMALAIWRTIGLLGRADIEISLED